MPVNNAGALDEKGGSCGPGILGKNSLIHDSIEGLEAELRVADDIGAKFVRENSGSNLSR